MSGYEGVPTERWSDMHTRQVLGGSCIGPEADPQPLSPIAAALVREQGACEELLYVLDILGQRLHGVLLPLGAYPKDEAPQDGSIPEHHAPVWNTIDVHTRQMEEAIRLVRSFLDRVEL